MWSFCKLKCWLPTVRLLFLHWIFFLFNVTTCCLINKIWMQFFCTNILFKFSRLIRVDFNACLLMKGRKQRVYNILFKSWQREVSCFYLGKVSSMLLLILRTLPLPVSFPSLLQNMFFRVYLRLVIT